MARLSHPNDARFDLGSFEGGIGSSSATQSERAQSASQHVLKGLFMKLYLTTGSFFLCDQLFLFDFSTKTNNNKKRYMTGNVWSGGQWWTVALGHSEGEEGASWPARRQDRKGLSDAAPVDSLYCQPEVVAYGEPGLEVHQDMLECGQSLLPGDLHSAAPCVHPSALFCWCQSPETSLYPKWTSVYTAQLF